MKISFDKWYPVVQPNVGMQADVFAKRVDKMNAIFTTLFLIAIAVILLLVILK